MAVSGLGPEMTPASPKVLDRLAILLTFVGSLGSEFLLPLGLQRGEFAPFYLSDYLTAENPGGCGKLACVLQPLNASPPLFLAFFCLTIKTACDTITKCTLPHFPYLGTTRCSGGDEALANACLSEAIPAFSSE